MICAGEDAADAWLPSCNAYNQLEQQSGVQAGQQQLKQEMQKALATLQHALQQQHGTESASAAAG